MQSPDLPFSIPVITTRNNTDGKNPFYKPSMEHPDNEKPSLSVVSSYWSRCFFFLIMLGRDCLVETGVHHGHGTLQQNTRTHSSHTPSSVRNNTNDVGMRARRTQQEGLLA